MYPLWILCYQRTGSHLLADHLNQTGLFDPLIDEWLNLFADDRLPKWAPWYNRLDLDLENMLQTLPPFSTVHRMHFEAFFKDEYKLLIEEHLPGIRYIRLRRKDPIALAVSIYVARETFTWTLYTLEEKEAYKNISLDYKKQILLSIYHKHLRMFSSWDEYLKDIEVLDIYYEDLQEDLQGTLEKTFEYLEIDQKPNASNSRIHKNEHPMKEELYQVLTDDINSKFVIPLPAPQVPLL